MSRILNFSDGFTSATEPTMGSFSPANKLMHFADDAAFVTYKGEAASQADIYYNTTSSKIRFYNSSAWVEVVSLDSSGNLTLAGDLTINGTTTTVNAANLDVVDKNITVNKSGNDASAQGAGLTVKRTATDGSIIYDSATQSKWKVGNDGSEKEVVDVSSSQTLTNKTLTSPVITTPTGIVKGDVGLSNVDNTSDATKNAATVTLTNKTLTSPVINTPTGIVKADVGLSNVDNTSDATKNAATVTLTNKTLTSPILTTPLTDIETFTEQGSTPATPAASKRKLYSKADGFYQLDSSGNETKVGSGAGGGSINFVTNGNADDALASIFTPYADAAGARPVDGTGGSPTVTTSITSTSPLAGTKSYLLTKPASNTQGQGWAIPFTVDLAYAAKMQKITFDYIVNSGTFVAGSSTTDSDVIWYIYDVTNSTLIEPSNIKMSGSSTTLSERFQGEFQTSATGSSYRLIAHVASTSALAYELKVDNISVAPSQYVYAAPVTAFKDVVSPPNITGSGGGTMTVGTGGGAVWSMAYRQVGEITEVEYKFRRGTTGFVDITGAVQLPLPPGVSYHSSIIGSDTVGYGEITATASANPVARLIGKAFGGGIILNVTDTALLSTAGLLATQTNYMTFKASFRAAGLSAVTQQSDGYDARPIIASGVGSITATTTTNVTKVPITSTIEDSALMINANGDITVKTSGWYDVEGISQINSGGTVNTISVTINIGGVSYRTRGQASANTHSATARVLKYINAGQIINLYTWVDTGSFAATVDFNIKKDQAPTTMSRGATIAHRYTTTATTAFTSAVPSVFAPNTIDSGVTTGAGGTYNTATGEFTANTSFTLDVCYSILFNTASWNASTRLDMNLQKGGVTIQNQISPYAQTTVSFPMADKGCFTVDVKAGDVIRLMVDQNSGSSKSLISTAFHNWIVFKRSGG